MGELETNILDKLEQSEKPLLYCRYVDDIFVLLKKHDDLLSLQNKFETNSVLHFTNELEKRHCLPFLDVSVERKNNSLSTAVFIKSTNSGDCINFQGLAPDKYKIGVIKTMLHRAYKICSTWALFHAEVRRLKQLFTNNNFPASLIDDTIKQFLDKRVRTTPATNQTEEKKTVLYYRYQMSPQYKQEEKNLRKILHNHVSAPATNFELHIFYKNKKLSQLLIKNNIHPNTTNSHVVYRYTCNKEECQPLQFYIGYTTTALKQRMTCHTQQGSIKDHHLTTHNHRVRTAEIMQSTEVIFRSQEKHELIVAEALLIKENSPPINSQREGETRVLQIF